MMGTSAVSGSHQDDRTPIERAKAGASIGLIAAGAADYR
jgi:hypothetical protein